MRYKIIPVLREVKEFVEEQGWYEYDPDYIEEILQQQDNTFEVAVESAELLTKLYHANFGERNHEQ